MSHDDRVSRFQTLHELCARIVTAAGTAAVSGPTTDIQLAALKVCYWSAIAINQLLGG